MAGELEAPLVDKKAKLKKGATANWEQAVPRGRSVVAFKFFVSLATRTAVGCVLYALLALIPGIIADANYLGMVSSGVTFVVFTVYANLGMTLAFAQQGFCGTLAACVYAHIMNALMPLGASGDHYVPVLAHGMNVFFIVFVLWLNIAKNTTMFMLCYHCYFAMEFVNPASATRFNTSWAIDYDAYTTTTIVTATVGLGTAILVTLIPTPIRATQAARDAARLSVNTLTGLMSDLVKYYEGDAPSVNIHRLEVVIDSLREITAGMEDSLAGTFWEAFFSKGKRRIQKQLYRHVTLMLRMSDNIAALQVCIAKEGFGDVHAACINQIKSEVNTLVSATRGLLEVATVAANDGDISDEERAVIRRTIDGTKEACGQLCVAFHKMRQQMSPNQAVNPELQSESFFVYCISVYSRYAVEYAEEILSLEEPPLPALQLIRESLWSLVDPAITCYDQNYRSFVLRNSLSVLICFYLGVYALGYSGIASGTCALLLSNYAGSALQKNLGRLQGVVVGNVIPHIVVQMVGSACSTSVTWTRSLMVLLWEILTNYIYYSSPMYGYIGCLAAAFGASVLVTPCTPATSPAEEAAAEAAFEHGSYEKIHETAIATIVLTLVDSVLAPKRASTMANEGLMNVLTMVDAGVQACFHKRTEDGLCADGPIISKHSVSGEKVVDMAHRKPGYILSKITEASTLAEEADKEPRLFRSPFPRKFFDSTIRFLQFLRANLNELEHVLQGSDTSYDDILAGVRPLKAFKEVKDEVEQALDDVLTLTKDVLDNETGQSRKEMVQMYLKRSVDGTIASMTKLVEEVNASGLKEEAVTTLEDDILCRISVVLMLLDTIYEHLHELVKLGITSS